VRVLRFRVKDIVDMLVANKHREFTRKYGLTNEQLKHVKRALERRTWKLS
jgi:uncharacterized protein (DUF433 family)